MRALGCGPPREVSFRRSTSGLCGASIAQTLTGINVQLAALKKEALFDTRRLDRSIARTQRLVEKYVNIVHEFARELRPAVLDDLGLIAALHLFVKLFSKRMRIHIDLKVFAKVEQLDIARRTVLFRVAQDALNLKRSFYCQPAAMMPFSG